MDSLAVALVFASYIIATLALAGVEALVRWRSPGSSIFFVKLRASVMRRLLFFMILVFLLPLVIALDFAFPDLLPISIGFFAIYAFVVAMVVVFAINQRRRRW